MQKTNIALVGFMGSGKSLLSRLLSEKLGKTRVSLDEEIEKKEERPITEIFAESGEAYFRKLEKEALKETASKSGLVIDCGGGIVLDPENMEILKSCARVVYLKTSAEVIYGRVKHHTHRPLLNVEDPQGRIAELLAQRSAFYELADDTVVTDNKTAEELSREIIGMLGL